MLFVIPGKRLRLFPRLLSPVAKINVLCVTKKSANPPPAGLLVIGYGNELRSDDGVGPRIAAAVAEWNLDGVRARGCHQLAPELADPIASARLVVFVDAAVDAPAIVRLRKVKSQDSVQIMTHGSDPQSLMGLAKQVFGRCPPAWWLTIPVENLDFGETLSPLARRGMQVALKKIRAMAGRR